MNNHVRKHRKRALNSVSLPADIAINTILALFAAICIIPFIFVIIISFTSTDSIRNIGFSFFPESFSMEAYDYVKTLGKQLWVSYFNSFFTTIVGTILSVAICVLYSYPLFRTDFKYRRFFTFFSFFTMLFGGGLAPTYMVCKNILGLSDNYAALIVPLLVNPFNIIVMRTFFQSSIPGELIESAAIDGSGEYRTLLSIILPITKPGIATIALMNMLGYWNEWFVGLLYVQKPALVPLQLLLVNMQKETEFLARNASIIGLEAVKLAASTPTENLRMALVVLIVVPIAFAYPFFQRFIISGLTIGSVKG